jgi:hypothetical protein
VKPAAAAANLLWLGANAPGDLRFARALRHVRRTQEAILRRCLRRNERTAFGRRHGFDSIESVELYRKRVPLHRHEDLQPDLERVAAGQSGVLTAQRVIRLEPTSGSSGPCKLISYTAGLQSELRAAVAPWIVDLCRKRPALLGGPAYWSITPAAPRPPTAVGAVPVGFEDDGAYLGGAFRRLVDATLAVPSSVARLHDPQRFRRATLLWLLAARELRLISVWHPSFLELLLAPLPQWWDGLLQDLERGGPVEGTGRTLRPNPARARELSALPLPDPRAIWPRLQLISCWADGPAELPAAALARRFPGVEVQPKGLLATEACVSLPYRGERPLAVTSHFFEFLDDEGHARCAWELQAGATYEVVVTTGGGLYRYRLGDQVRVTGRLLQAPCVQFLGRRDGVSDLFGEKLAEPFVADAIARVLGAARIKTPFALLAPESDVDGTRYALFVELELPREPLRQATDALSDLLHAALCENPNYEWCARLGQLHPARAIAVPRGAYKRYAERLAQDGRRLGAIKPAALSRLTGWADWLQRADVPVGPAA